MYVLSQLFILIVCTNTVAETAYGLIRRIDMVHRKRGSKKTGEGREIEC